MVEELLNFIVFRLKEEWILQVVPDVHRCLVLKDIIAAISLATKKLFIKFSSVILAFVVRVVLNVESIRNIVVDVCLIRVDWEFVIVFEERVTLLLDMGFIVLILELKRRVLVVKAVIFGAFATFSAFSTFSSFSTFSTFCWSGLPFSFCRGFTLGSLSFPSLCWSFGSWNGAGSAYLFLPRLSFALLSLGNWIIVLRVVVIFSHCVSFRILIVPVGLFLLVRRSVITMVVIVLVVIPGLVRKLIELRIVVVSICVIVVIVFRNAFDRGSTPVVSGFRSVSVFHHIVPLFSVVIVVMIFMLPIELLSMTVVGIMRYDSLSW